MSCKKWPDNPRTKKKKDIDNKKYVGSTFAKTRHPLLIQFKKITFDVSVY
ncbi:MAG: hypothetical protein M3Y60_03925 [Bacteroidota bacterium]|nr:hypothetical protein [Bacteroidota bacterium]